MHICLYMADFDNICKLRDACIRRAYEAGILYGKFVEAGFHELSLEDLNNYIPEMEDFLSQFPSENLTQDVIRLVVARLR